MAATVIPTVPEYTGDVPLIGQGEPTFSTNAQNSLVFQADLPVDLNTSIAQMNVLSSQLNDSLTRTVIANDSELYSLPPNAPVQINGGTLRPNALIGTLINDVGVAGKRGVILHEESIGGVWFYASSSANPSGFSGELIDLTGQSDGGDVFGGYSERVGSTVTDIDASQYNVVYAALSGAHTISFINIPTQSYTCEITVSDSDGTLALTFPQWIYTAGGTAPTFTVGGTDKIIMRTLNQGTTWDVSVINDWKAV